MRCSSVIFKLLATTVAMVVAPIGSYYLTLNTLFNGIVFETGVKR